MTTRLSFLFVVVVVVVVSIDAAFKPASERRKCSDAPLTPSDTKLAAIRRRMRDAALDAYVVSAADQHISEYIGDFDKRRRWLSGFSGSAGVAGVVDDAAVIWTDGRYFLQAENELDCNWGILELVPTMWTWLGDRLEKGSKIGADPKLFSIKEWELATTNPKILRKNVTLIPLEVDLIDADWTTDRPPRPSERNIEIHPLKFAGVTWEEKTTMIREKMEEEGADVLLVLDLMEVAWLLNIRGSDVPYNPVVYSFVIVPKSKDLPLKWFVGKRRVGDLMVKHLRPDCGQTFGYYIKESEMTSSFCPNVDVEIRDYEDFYDEVDKLLEDPKLKFWFSEHSNYEIFRRIPAHRRLFTPPPIRDAKAVKNPTERAGMRAAHVRDAAALIEYAAALERRVDAGERPTEAEVAEEVGKMRKSKEESMGESFPTIAGYGANGAIIHYNPSKNSSPAKIGAGQLLLDSGGQYRDGTTDVTRTFHYGTPNKLQIDSYTRVLMGQIDLAMSVFPDNKVTGNELQIRARSPLWRRGMEYLHGTGHGIGSYLSVHEPPGLRAEVVKEGQFFSDEPGYYLAGMFGVRLENICFAERVALPFETPGRPFLRITTVTLVPYEPKLIDVSLLSNRQRHWLNEYHKQCLDVIGPELKKAGATEAYDWLKARTNEIPLRVDSNGGKGCIPGDVFTRAMMGVAGVTLVWGLLRVN